MLDESLRGLYAKGAVELDRAAKACSSMADLVRTRADGDIEDPEFFAAMRVQAKILDDSTTKAKEYIE